MIVISLSSLYMIVVHYCVFVIDLIGNLYCIHVWYVH